MIGGSVSIRRSGSGGCRGQVLARRLSLRPLLDTLLPHRCLSCGTLVEAAGVLCPDCWLGVEMIGPPQCDACGLPFAYDIGEGTLCGGLLAGAAAIRQEPGPPLSTTIGSRALDPVLQACGPHGRRRHLSPAG